MEHDKPTGFTRAFDIILVDSLVRSLIERLHGIDDFCDEIRFSVERSEASLRKLLTQLDAEPLEETWSASCS